jgi:hypothetical protein
MFRDPSFGTLVVALSLVFMAFAPRVVPAQTFRGTIMGTVTDNTTAVIPGADVSAKNTETGLTRTTSTDSVGNFTIPELPIGIGSST